MDVPFHTFISLYPWDLADEGVGEVLDRLQGEIGLTGVAVWAAVPPVVQLRVRNVAPRVFRTSGGLLFKPGASHYQATRCKPLTADWSKSRDSLKNIAAQCHKRNLDLRLIASASRTGRLAQRHPQMASKNLFGDESPSTLCLANPDVQSWLNGLLADMKEQFDPAAVVLTDLRIGLDDVPEFENQTAPAMGVVEHWLLSLCFCESCLQKAEAASAAPAMAKAAAERIISTSLDQGRPKGGSATQLLAKEPDLSRFCEWRDAELSQLLGTQCADGRVPLIIERSSDAQPHPFVPGADGRSVPAWMTIVESPGSLNDSLDAGAGSNELAVRESLIQHGDGSELVATLNEAARRGVPGIQLDNYGNLPDVALTSIAQAIRFARRTAEALAE